MIFHLEINGHLKNCRVPYPHDQRLATWNEVRRLVPSDGRAWDYATAQLKSIAAEIVSAGAYEVCD